jgi:hypothetical protein
MSIRNAIILLLTICILCCVFLYINYNIEQKRPKAIEYEYKSDSLKKLVDSLNQELFKQQLVIGKYDIALEMLKEENPDAAATFELILNTKTE